MDLRFGYPKYTTGPERVGWLLNMQPVRMRKETKKNNACKKKNVVLIFILLLRRPS